MEENTREYKIGDNHKLVGKTLHVDLSTLEGQAVGRIFGYILLAQQLRKEAKKIFKIVGK